MRYMRVEENAMDSPKFIAIGDRAWRLWCEGGTYCQKHLTDGLIPLKALRGFRYYSKAAMTELLATNVPEKGPLWHLDGDFVRVHDYLDWNDARERVLANRKAGKDRLDRWRAEHAKKHGVAPAHETRYETTSHAPSKRNGTEQNNPPERAPEESVTPARAARGFSGGVMAGSLPRDHVRHAFCGRKCVPDFLHGELRQSIGGADPDAAIRQFYADVMASIPDDQPIGEEPLKFWRTQFAARFGSAVPAGKTAGNVAAAARFVARGKA